MAYDKEELIKMALVAIKDHKLIFIDEVVCFLPCDKTTFYRHECNECHSIKDALYGNRVTTKGGLRKKWYDGDNATAQLALYKLCADPDELDRLTTNNNKTNLNVKIDKSGLTEKELNDQIKALE